MKFLWFTIPKTKWSKFLVNISLYVGNVSSSSREENERIFMFKRVSKQVNTYFLIFVCYTPCNFCDLEFLKRNGWNFSYMFVKTLTMYIVCLAGKTSTFSSSNKSNVGRCIFKWFECTMVHGIFVIRNSRNEMKKNYWRPLRCWQCIQFIL